MAPAHDLWIGIDVGKTEHHACAIDSNGKTVWSMRISNSQEAIEQLIGKGTATARSPRWAIDITSGESAILCTLLLAAAQTLVYIPGRVVNRMSAAFGGESKTDAKDARVIADIARLHANLRAVEPKDPVVAQLMPLLSHRKDLNEDWVRGINRLRSSLASIFPALEQALDLKTLAPLKLLTVARTPAQLRGMDKDALSRRLIDLGVRRPTALSLAEKSLTAAGAQTIELPGEEIVNELVAAQARKLVGLHGEIYELDKRIAACFREHEAAQIIESMPGFGPVVGAEFLAVTNGRLESFPNSGHLAALAGLVPVARDSGRVAGNHHRPKRYNRRLRRAFFMAALSSLKSSEASRRFYDRKRCEGRNHTQAILALARRLVNVLWALLREGRTFTASPPAPTAVITMPEEAIAA
ncbi:IS110 family transposase [Sinomonas gamaensis]|uniref:IS110 family transposase n=1 Tax=Sinomonas gamaensis TaxID=2565624 RepID=UPI0011092AAA|nr:IS110 family transposase [Sinomonas gamaensis]